MSISLIEAFKREIEDTLRVEVYYSPGGYGLNVADRSLTILNPFVDETYELKIHGEHVILRTTARQTMSQCLSNNISYDLCNPKCIDMIISKLNELCDPYCEFKK